MASDVLPNDFDAVLTHVIESLGELANKHLEEVENLRSENATIRAGRGEELGKPKIISIDDEMPVVAMEPEKAEPIKNLSLSVQPVHNIPDKTAIVGFVTPPSLNIAPSLPHSSGHNSSGVNGDARRSLNSSGSHAHAQGPQEELAAALLTHAQGPQEELAPASIDITVDLGSDIKRRQQYHASFVPRKIWADRMDLDRISLQHMYNNRVTGSVRSMTDSFEMSDPKQRLTLYPESQVTAELYRILSKIMINPHSNKRALWLFLCVAILLYDIVLLPLELGFNLESTTLRDRINFVSVLFWTMDLPMNFITGYVMPTHVEMRPKHTCHAYLRSWFGFDVLLVVQDWVNIIFVISDALSSVRLGRSFRLGRLLRFSRMVRLVRIAKLRHALQVLMLRCGASISGVHTTSTWTYLTVLLCISIHFQTCIWHAIGDSLDNGWVSVNEVREWNVGKRYAMALHWTCARLHGMSSHYILRSTRERLADSALIVWSLITVAIFAGQLAALFMALVTSRLFSFKRTAHSFVHRHGISLALYNRLMKFFTASQLGSASAIAADEARLFKEIPSALREDLIYESRVPALCGKRVFNDMWQENSRVLRHVCNQAMSVQIVIDDEIVFADGDAGSKMMFVTSGKLRYKCKAGCLVTWGLGSSGSSLFSEKDRVTKKSRISIGLLSISDRSSGSESDADDRPGQVVLGDLASVCEACLWTEWQHVGSLVGIEECMLLALEAQDFGDVILQHPEALVHSVKYAKRYVWYLNQARVCGKIHDLIDIPFLNTSCLDEDLVSGGEEDHFIFISHYKVEAGTEATLLRDLFEVNLADDPQHHAHHLLSPFFIDSEDLEDLSSLKAHVKKTQGALLLLLTPGVLSRPWCLLELVTAIRHGVSIVPVEVQRPGCTYAYPDEDFFQRLLNGEIVDEQGVSLLEKEGISMQDVEMTIRQVFQKIAVPFSPHKSRKVRNAEIQDILRRCGTEDNKSVAFSKGENMFSAPKRLSILGRLSQKVKSRRGSQSKGRSSKASELSWRPRRSIL